MENINWLKWCRGSFTGQDSLQQKETAGLEIKCLAFLCLFLKKAYSTKYIQLKQFGTGWKYCERILENIFFSQFTPSWHIVMISQSNSWFCLGLIWLGFLVVGWRFVFSSAPHTLGGRPLYFATVLRANKGMGWVASWSVVLQGSEDWH